jgi:hypothetical protein
MLNTLANVGMNATPAPAAATDAPHSHIEPWPASTGDVAIPVNPHYLNLPQECATSAADWLAPWGKYAYPGRRAVFLALLPAPYSWQAVHHWMKGRRTFPVDVARAISRAIRTRIAAGAEIADALDAYADSQAVNRPRGFCVVGADGKDKRGHWRR